ncbi:hypothetical protein ACWD0A_34695 [Streptomyces sp. NPDC002867]
MVATVLAALAALGGLWAQAVATYWSQQTAKDQLDQSKEDSERERQEQASKVTFWVEYPRAALPTELHIVNRSPDPVSLVWFVMKDEETGKKRRWLLFRPNLRPCSEVIYSVRKMELAPNVQSGKPDKWIKLSGEFEFEFERMIFVDRSGRNWERSPRSLTERPRQIPYNYAGLVIVGDEQVKKTDNCSDGAN